MISAAVVGVGKVQASFAASALLSSQAMKRVIRRNTYLLETRVKARASGRPGPNAPTGDYRRSITHDIVDTGFNIAGYVGTNAPQGRRLEFGFTGHDSLGRYYDQPPYPHFGPAVDDITPGFNADLEAEINGALA